VSNQTPLSLPHLVRFFFLGTLDRNGIPPLCFSVFLPFTSPFFVNVGKFSNASRGAVPPHHLLDNILGGFFSLPPLKKSFLRLLSFFLLRSFFLSLFKPRVVTYSSPWTCPLARVILPFYKPRGSSNELSSGVSFRFLSTLLVRATWNPFYQWSFGSLARMPRFFVKIFFHCDLGQLLLFSLLGRNFPTYGGLKQLLQFVAMDVPFLLRVLPRFSFLYRYEAFAAKRTCFSSRTPFRPDPNFSASLLDTLLRHCFEFLCGHLSNCLCNANVPTAFFGHSFPLP